MEIFFEVDIEPRGKDRGRAVVRRRKDGSVTAGVITSDKTREWEKQFREKVRRHVPVEMIDMPVRVDIMAIFKRPKYMCEVVKKTGKWKYPRGLLWKESKPDRDNVAKIVLDAMDSFWLDDSLVVAGETVKLWADVLDKGKIVVRVTDDIGKPFEHLRKIGML